MGLHKISAVLSKIVTTSFNQRRIYWQDEEHELRFVNSDNRKQVCLESIRTASEAITGGIAELSSGSGAELKIIDLLLAISTISKLCADKFREIPDLKDYNAWVLSIGGDTSEKTTDIEVLASYVAGIRELRVGTYPLWESLIDLLPAGNVLHTAMTNLEMGRKCLHVDYSEVEQKWELALS